jgi:hypothetical protein
MVCMDAERAKGWLEANEHWLAALAAIVVIGTPLIAIFRANIVAALYGFGSVARGSYSASPVSQRRA